MYSGIKVGSSSLHRYMYKVLANIPKFGKNLLLKYFRRARELRKLNSRKFIGNNENNDNLRYDNTCNVCKSQRNVPIYGVSSPVTVQDIVPPHRKNEHTPDDLHGKCPMIPQHRFIDLERCAAHTLQDFSSSCLSHFFYIHVSRECNNFSELLHARSLTRGRIPELFK